MTKTLNLKEAAAFLNMHPDTLREKAAAGIIPGSKPSKCWVFIEHDLVEVIRSGYKPKKPNKPEITPPVPNPELYEKKQPSDHTKANHNNQKPKPDYKAYLKGEIDIFE